VAQNKIKAVQQLTFIKIALITITCGYLFCYQSVTKPLLNIQSPGHSRKQQTWSIRIGFKLEWYLCDKNVGPQSQHKFSAIDVLYPTPQWSANLSWWWGFAPMTQKISEIWRVGAN